MSDEVAQTCKLLGELFGCSWDEKEKDVEDRRRRNQIKTLNGAVTTLIPFFYKAIFHLLKKNNTFFH